MNSTQQVEEKARKFSISIIIMVVVFFVVLCLFWLLTDEVVFDKESVFDHRVYELLHDKATPARTHFMQTITFFGSRAFLLPAYSIIIAFYLFVKKDRGNSLSIAAIALSGAGVLFLLKQTFQRHRPLEPLLQHVDGFSYPSGHSFSAFTFSGILIYMLWISNLGTVLKWVFSVVLFLFACTIAFSRVYLHVHFATDVIAGFGLSFLWLFICYFILRRTGLIKPRTKANTG